MWKWIVSAVVALILALGALGFYLQDKIYVRWEHATVTAADFDREFSSEQLRSDFRYLTKTVEHIHPDVMAIVDRATYPQRKAQTLAALNQPMTRAEFFRLLAPFTGTTYNEGHTEIIPLNEEWTTYQKHGGTAPPFAVKVEPWRLITTKSMAGVQIPVGSEIVSINGVDAAALRHWLLETQSMETLRGREAYGAARFAERLWSYGVKSPYKIAYRAPGATEPLTLDAQGVPEDVWRQERAIGKDKSIDLTIGSGVAHLVIKDFDQPWDRYEGWLRDAFQRIHDQHVRALVLDFRDNSGGDTRQSDEPQAYLSDSILPAVAEVEVKTTPEVKAIYRTLLLKGFRWIPLNDLVPMLRGIQNAPDNGFYRFHPEGTEPEKRTFPRSLAYHGDLYLLIGPYTYSSALIAAAPYKYWKRATVIGQRTEEGLTFYGDWCAFDLPNTKIQMHISHKLFRLVGSGGRNSQIEPDIATSPQHPDAYQLALDVIAQRKSAVRQPFFEKTIPLRPTQYLSKDSARS